MIEYEELEVKNLEFGAPMEIGETETDECSIKTCQMDAKLQPKYEMVCRRTCPKILCHNGELLMFNLEQCEWECKLISDFYEY